MKKILIADDQPEVRELVKVTLEVGDYQIITAEDGQQALELASHHLPDLMLLDVMMPNGPNGLEVCRELKSNAETRDIYVVILTARGQDQDVQAGYDSGADGYFIKPFSPLELIEKIADALRV